MDWIWTLLFIGIAIFIGSKFFNPLDFLKSKFKKTVFPYKSKPLLTDHEFEFYKNLRPLIEHYGLHIIAKTRFADIIEVSDKAEKSEWASNFGKIKAKHIDFIIVDPDDFNVELLIELDDSSHNSADRKERDDFVNDVCRKCDLLLIRTMGELEEIEKYLDENWVRL